MAINKKVWGSVRFWSQLGADTKIQYRNYIFDEGKNVYGTKWWNGKYSTQYDDMKKGRKFKFAQYVDYQQDVTAVLTGKIFKDFKAYLKVEMNGFEFGYPTRGKLVASLRKRKGKAGTLTSKDKPVPDKVSRFIAKEYHKWVKKGQYNQTRTHGKGGAKTRPRKK